MVKYDYVLSSEKYYTFYALGLSFPEIEYVSMYSPLLQWQIRANSILT